MAKYLQLPDGNALKVPDEMGYNEAMALAQQRLDRKSTRLNSSH